MLFGFDWNYFVMWFKSSAIDRELSIFNVVSNRLNKAIQKAQKQRDNNNEQIYELNEKNADHAVSIRRASNIIDKITDLLRA